MDSLPDRGQPSGIKFGKTPKHIYFFCSASRFRKKGWPCEDSIRMQRCFRYTRFLLYFKLLIDFRVRNWWRFYVAEGFCAIFFLFVWLDGFSWRRWYKWATVYVDIEKLIQYKNAYIRRIDAKVAFCWICYLERSTKYFWE